MGCGTPAQQQSDMKNSETLPYDFTQNKINEEVLAEEDTEIVQIVSDEIDDTTSLIEHQFLPPKQREYKIQYITGQVCGEGTFGKVYTAIERTTGLPLAVKELKTDGMNEQQLKEVETEIHFMTNLTHENIVRIYDAFRVEKKIFIVMEHLQGGSLQSLTRQFKGIPEVLARRHFKQLVSALAHMHHSNCAHLDLKCANVMLAADQRLRLVDFGTSIRATVPVAAGVRGSPYWIAPECVRTRTYDVFKADIWSLGATLLELIDSVPPYFQIKQAPAVLYHVSQLESPPGFNSAVSGQCLDFSRRCLQLDPAERADIDELLAHKWLMFEAGGELNELIPDENAFEEKNQSEAFKDQDLLSLKESIIGVEHGKGIKQIVKIEQDYMAQQVDWAIADLDYNDIAGKHVALYNDLIDM
ncbi:Kinase [Hexamita inflata]|uniref:Kinase n=1 Tax=Hexamita inflata TaxID=28002 RepID=A0AA86TGH7_9EUKA|nr:Kinase [Hexamita inflata]